MEENHWNLYEPDVLHFDLTILLYNDIFSHIKSNYIFKYWNSFKKIPRFLPSRLNGAVEMSEIAIYFFSLLKFLLTSSVNYIFTLALQWLWINVA